MLNLKNILAQISQEIYDSMERPNLIILEIKEKAQVKGTENFSTKL